MTIDKHTVQARMDVSRSIIEDAIAEHNPIQVVVLYSGGVDSWVLAHVAHEIMNRRDLQVYSIDTTMSADGWRDYVHFCAKSEGWEFELYENGRGYRQWVKYLKKMGFPYAEAGHNWAYRALKERAIDAKTKALKRGKSRQSRVLYLTGIRRDESARRKRNATTQRRDGSAVFCNPLIDWPNDLVAIYAVENGMPPNPFYETVGGSGDCQCNWGNFITLDILETHSPELYKKVKVLNDQISVIHGWGWDQKPDYKSIRLIERGQMQFDYDDMFLCAGCNRSRKTKKHKTDATQEEVLRRIDWSE